MNLSLIDRTDQEIKQVDQQLRTLRERKIYLQSELAQMNPNQALYSEQGERLLGSGDRLKILKIELARLSGIYSDTHPDIQRINREISALEKERGGSQNSNNGIRSEITLLKQQLSEAEQKYSSNHPDIISLKRTITSLETSLNSNSATNNIYPANTDISNPAYSQLLAQLEASNSEYNSLTVTRSSLRAKIQMLEQRLIDSPEVERKYSALIRNYDNAKLKYTDVKAKLSEARNR